MSYNQFINNIKIAGKEKDIGFTSKWFRNDPEYLNLIHQLYQEEGINDVDQFSGLGELKQLFTSKDGLSFLEAYNAGQGAEWANKNKLTNLAVILSGAEGNIVQNIANSMIRVMSGTLQNPIYKGTSQIQKSSLYNDLTPEKIEEWLTRELITEIENNPDLTYIMGNKQALLGSGAGAPQTESTIRNTYFNLGRQLPNDAPLVDNFINLLITLIHNNIAKRNPVRVASGSSIPTTLEQDFAFASMCSGGAAADSRSAQYEILKWIEATENSDGADDASGVIGKFEQFKSGDKSLRMIKKIGDFLGSNGFAAAGGSFEKFEALFEILDKNGKPGQAKWDASPLKASLLSVFGPIDTDRIAQMMYVEGANFSTILLSFIPEGFHNLYYQMINIDELSDVDKKIYLEQHPELAGLFVDDISDDEDIPKQIRTQQLLDLRQGVVTAWADYYKRFFEDLKQRYPQMDTTQFITLINLNPKKEKLVNLFMQNMRIGPNELSELLSIRDTLLDIDLLFDNGKMPSLAKLWSEPMIFAGREIIDRNKIGKIERTELLEAAGFNKLIEVDDDIIRSEDEDIENYKQRMGISVYNLIAKLCKDERFIFANPVGAARSRIQSPFSFVMVPEGKLQKEMIWDEVSRVHAIVSAVLDEADIEIEKTTGQQLKSPSRDNPKLRREAFDDLFSRFNSNILPEELMGKLNDNPKYTKVPDPDPEFKAIGMTVPSQFAFNVLELFRNDFNLPICSYEFQIDSPVECTMNPNGFAMDFILMADKLINKDGMISMVPKLLIAGEALGYNAEDSAIPLYSADGKNNDMQKTNENLSKLYGQQYMGFNEPGCYSIDKSKRLYMGQWEDQQTVLCDSVGEDGNRETRPATVGDEYSSRSSWKKPHQTFLAHGANCDTIYVQGWQTKNGADKQQSVASVREQLDNMSILWSTPSDQSNAVKYVMAAVDRGELVDPVILQKYGKDSGFDKPYTNAQMYAHGVLAQFDLEQVIIPLYRSNPQIFSAEAIYSYRQKYIQYCEALRNAMDIEGSGKSANPSSTELMMRIENLYEQTFGVLKKMTEAYVSGEKLDTSEAGIKHQEIVLKHRAQIMNVISDLLAGGNVSVADVHSAVSYKPMKTNNIVNYWKFPGEVFTRAAKSLGRWWRYSLRNP